MDRSAYVFFGVGFLTSLILAGEFYRRSSQPKKSVPESEKSEEALPVAIDPITAAVAAASESANVCDAMKMLGERLAGRYNHVELNNALYAFIEKHKDHAIAAAVLKSLSVASSPSCAPSLLLTPFRSALSTS